LAQDTYEARPNIMGYRMPNGKVLFLIAEGRLMNLAAGQGIQLRLWIFLFAAQFLSLRYLMQNKGALQPQVLQVPSEVDEEVARIKLDSLGIKIDQLTESQKEYLSRW